MRIEEVNYLLDSLVRDNRLDRPPAKVSPTLRAALSVLVLVEILVNATLAEGVEALIDGVGIAEEPLAERTLEPLVQILLFDPSDQSSLPSGPKHLLPCSLRILMALIHV